MSDFDAVVIGSGMGGLTAALSLARAGRKVGVFEQHTLPGGWSHNFNLEGYSFCAGLHYLGELGEGQGLRTIFEGLGLGPHLTFYQQNPDATERCFIGDQRFDIPAGRAAFEARLAERFPAEKAGITRYFDIITRMYDELGAAGQEEGVLAQAARLPTAFKYAWTSFDRFLDRFTEDKLLRAILTIQAGDHCMPPSACPTLVQTSVTSHYLEGGFYPRHGGRSIVAAFVKELRHHGGEIHLRSRVSEILMEGRAAAGIRLADGGEVHAPVVISNADPGVTWGKLVPAGHVRARDRHRLSSERWSPGMVSLFFATEGDVRALGLDSGNIWTSRDSDVGAIYEYAQSGQVNPPPDLPGIYLGCSSLKDPSARKDGRHTFEAFSFVPTGFFEQWSGSDPDHRPAEYLAFKAAYAQRIREHIEAFVPGLTQRIVFESVSTPLTNAHFVAATRGAAYGTERKLKNMGPFGFPVRTAIPRLYQVGASTWCHGVYGACRSGLMAAESILGVKRQELLAHSAGPITVLPAEPAT